MEGREESSESDVESTRVVAVLLLLLLLVGEEEEWESHEELDEGELRCCIVVNREVS